MSENLAGIQGDVSGMIGNWGKHCTISRASLTATNSGRYSGSYATVGSGTFIIEPLGSKYASKALRQQYGLLDDTTHILYGRTGSSINVEDRIFASGSSYWYDVLSTTDVQVTHVRAQVRLMKKS